MKNYFLVPPNLLTILSSVYKSKTKSNTPQLSKNEHHCVYMTKHCNWKIMQRKIRKRTKIEAHPHTYMHSNFITFPLNFDGKTNYFPFPP